MSEFEALHRFIANNYDLEELEARLQEFNPFTVLKADHYEVRHSNVVAWLLDPKGNHNLREAFVKKVLSEILVNNEHLETDFNVFQVHEMNFGDVEIHREYNNIDILLVSRQSKLVVLIENKIHSTESKGQLQRYLADVLEQFHGFHVIPVFLTLEGSEPSDSRYAVLSYVQVLDILRFTLKTQRENLSHRLFDFLNYYQRTLEILTMEDKELKALCKKIYKDHKEAIDLIWEHADEDDFEEAAREFVAGQDATLIRADGRKAWFIPKELLPHLQLVAEESWCNCYPVCYWFVAKEEKLGIIIEVGPFLDGDLRRKFLHHLKANDISIYDRSFKPGARYTRIFTKYPRFDDWDNKESISQKMDDLVNKVVQKFTKKLIEACESFDWSS